VASFMILGGGTHACYNAISNCISSTRECQ